MLGVWGICQTQPDIFNWWRLTSYGNFATKVLALSVNFTVELAMVILHHLQ